MKGKFISFEGIEGVGKSTVMRKVCTWLKSKGIDVVKTCEPGGTHIANRIRRILLANSREQMTSEAEACLMFASRSQHIHSLILPSIQDGKWVVSDRFVDSSYAYQVAGRGISVNVVAFLDRWVCGDNQPDVVYVLDMPVSSAMHRISHRVPDRIESEKEAFFERVRDAFLKRSEEFPDRVKVINAALPLSTVLDNIKDDLKQRFDLD